MSLRVSLDNLKMSNIGQKMSGPMQLGADSGPILETDRWMFFATRNRVASGTIYTALASNNYMCSKIIVRSPKWVTREFKFHLPGFASTEGGNSPQETVVTGTVGTPGNSVVVDEMWAVIDGIPYQLKFSTNDGVTVVDQTNGQWTDDLVTPDVAPKTNIELWLFYHVAVGEKVWPVYRYQKHRGERVWSATDLATLKAFMSTPLAASSAALDINYSLQTQPQFYGADFMVAKGDYPTGEPVCLVMVDSIGESRQGYSASANSAGEIGWLRQWLSDDANSIAYCMIGMPGNHSVLEYTGSGSTIATRRRDIIREIKAFNGGLLPFTTILNQLGQNDTSTSYNTWFNTNYRSAVTRLRAEYPDVVIVAMPPLGRTASTKSITALTSVSTVATATMLSTAHLVSGQSLSIAGATPSAYNGTYTITVINATQFTYNFAGGTSPATGTITGNDVFLTQENQVYAANNTWPSDGTDASGKWRLRDDILAKTSSCCDRTIDTYDAWVSTKGQGKWPGMNELPTSLVTVQGGTDGVATYTQITVADGSLFSPEQEVQFYSADGLTRLTTRTLLDVTGNVLTFNTTATIVVAVGCIAMQTPCVNDGVHPFPVMMKRIRTNLPQSEKSKLVA